MPFSTTHAAVRFSRGLSAIALGIAAAACGGGGGEEGRAVAAADSSLQGVQAVPAASVVAATHKVAAPMSVMVEGCVLDRHYIPTTGTPVRALAADGRLLGSAQSDGQGRFTLRLPARTEVLLQVDRPQGESLAMRVEAASSYSGTCLLDDQA
ncbi:MAG: hypothetical protein JNN03_05420 [Rubrivivax sp.]|nr:hypothetical protein [Rubrivivax sp.]